jgi:hypothetical protein
MTEMRTIAAKFAIILKITSIMYEEEMKNNRRKFLTKSLALLGFIPFLNLNKSFAAVKCPQELKIDAKNVLDNLLDPSSPMAKGLAYYPNASDGKTHQKYKQGNLCGNCKFYDATKEEQAHAPCSLIGKKYVASCGWCQSYVQGMAAPAVKS